MVPGLGGLDRGDPAGANAPAIVLLVERLRLDNPHLGEVGRARENDVPALEVNRSLNRLELTGFGGHADNDRRLGA